MRYLDSRIVWHNFQAVDDPLHLGLTTRETPEERRLRKRVFLKDNMHWCANRKTFSEHHMTRRQSSHLQKSRYGAR